jgi:hypothetical protein
MGANTISYAPNNPIGGKGTINASGSYTTDPGVQVNAISFTASDGLGSNGTVTYGGGSWTIAPLALTAGTYTCTATLSVVQNNRIWVADNAVANNIVVN